MSRFRAPALKIHISKVIINISTSLIKIFRLFGLKFSQNTHRNSRIHKEFSCLLQNFDRCSSTLFPVWTKSCSIRFKSILEQKWCTGKRTIHGQLAQGLSFFATNEKSETETVDGLKIWKRWGQSVSLDVLMDRALLLIRLKWSLWPILPLTPNTAGPERNQISFATKVAIKAQPKVDQSAQCIQFWLFFTNLLQE